MYRGSKVKSAIHCHTRRRKRPVVLCPKTRRRTAVLCPRQRRQIANQSQILRRMWFEHEMADLVPQMEALRIKD